MPKFDVPNDIKVEDFFNNFVPEHFKKTVGAADLSFLEGKEFTMQFDVDGKKFCLRIKGDKSLELIDGGIGKPMLWFQMTEDFWRESITEQIDSGLDEFTEAERMADANRYNALLKTSGTLKAELDMPDGSVSRVNLVFNGGNAPEVTVKLALEDWASMQRREVDGMNLVMGGKMQFEGDMPFLLELQQLL